MSEEYPKYEAGEPVIYINGAKAELGIVKRACGGDDYFVNYHTGDTAARTHASHLVKISNKYAFHIVRLDPDGNERKKIVGTTTVDKSFERLLLDRCPEVKKKLKALEVIRKDPQRALLISDYNNFDEYVNDKDPYWIEKELMMKEEFDLLKEVME